MTSAPLPSQQSLPRGPAIPTDDRAIVRRKKSLATTGPIADLDRMKVHFDGDHWQQYDLEAIALALIDQVALHMGISSGMAYSAAVDYAASQARVQCPQAGADEQQQVGLRVLTGLIGTEPFKERYLEHGPDGPVWRVYSFRLLEEALSFEGETYLRATQEAINVLIDGLDVDIESAQVATEALMRALIERGSLGEATAIAERARLQTAAYLEKIRVVERDTLLDLEAHDWLVEVPQALDAALAHVCDRIDAEAALQSAVADMRDSLTDPEARASANLMLGILADCQHRNSELQEHLIGVGARMRAAQDARFERRSSGLPRHDLHKDLVCSLVAATPSVASEAAEVIWRQFAGVPRSLLPHWSTLLDLLLEPAEAPTEGAPVEEPEFSAEESSEWWEPYWDMAEALLADVASPTTLSAVLARVQPGTVADVTLTAEALASAVCHQAYALRSTPLVGDDGPYSALLAIPLDTPLDSPYASGCDLLIVPVTVAATGDARQPVWNHEIPEGALL